MFGNNAKIKYLLSEAERFQKIAELNQKFNDEVDKSINALTDLNRLKDERIKRLEARVKSLESRSMTYGAAK